MAVQVSRWWAFLDGETGWSASGDPWSQDPGSRGQPKAVSGPPPPRSGAGVGQDPRYGLSRAAWGSMNSHPLSQLAVAVVWGLLLAAAEVCHLLLLADWRMLTLLPGVAVFWSSSHCRQDRASALAWRRPARWPIWKS